MSKEKSRKIAKRLVKQEKKVKVRRKLFLIISFLLSVFILSFPVTIIYKSIKRNVFYKNYIVYINHTKIVLFPDITQKDRSMNLKIWKGSLQRFIKLYKNDLTSLSPILSQIELKEKEGKWEDVNHLVMETRMMMLRIVKNKNYYSQTIMMEDLLTLIFEMEETIKQKDDLKLMDEYKDFNSKFTLVVPNLIKSDVIKIGNAMDRIYKLALFQNLQEATQIFSEIKSIFISSYRDYQPK